MILLPFLHPKVRRLAAAPRAVLEERARSIAVFAPHPRFVPPAVPLGLRPPLTVARPLALRTAAAPLFSCFRVLGVSFETFLAVRPPLLPTRWTARFAPGVSLAAGRFLRLLMASPTPPTPLGLAAGFRRLRGLLYAIDTITWVLLPKLLGHLLPAPPD